MSDVDPRRHPAQAIQGSLTVLTTAIERGLQDLKKHQESLLVHDLRQRSLLFQRNYLAERFLCHLCQSKLQSSGFTRPVRKLSQQITRVRHSRRGHPLRSMKDLLMVPESEYQRLQTYYKGQVASNALMDKVGRLGAQEHLILHSNIPDSLAGQRRALTRRIKTGIKPDAPGDS